MHKEQHLLALSDHTREQLLQRIERARVLKNDTKCRPLAGKIACLIFEKASTRTRVSFETAMYALGGQVVFQTKQDSHLGRGEPLKDMARVLSRYADALVVRTFGQEVVEELARYAGVPVINALTDRFHPCQILSDLLTVTEKKGALEKLDFAWIGDGNNMANTWIEAAAIFGFNLRLACPQGYAPDGEVLQWAMDRAPGRIRLMRDPVEAVKAADVINVDVWASMGQEKEQQRRALHFRDYQVNAALMSQAEKDAIVLHCLPAHRGEEISEEVLEGPQSVAFDQAENKKHLHKAILEHFILKTAV